MVRKTEIDSVPVEELKTPAMVSVRNFAKSVLIVLLSFACIFAGMLIYQLRSPDEDFQPAATERKTPVLRRPMMAKSPVVLEKKSEPTVSVSAGLMKQPAVLKPAVKTEVEPEPVKVIPETKTAEPVQSLAKETKVVPTVPVEPMLPLEVALNLRDHLALGASCLSEFKTIMKSRIPGNIDRDNLIETLMPVCVNQAAFEDMETVFKASKKRALMTYYLLNNPIWLAYLKTVGTTLVDVRRLHPLKQKPKDLMSLAQSALAAHHMVKARDYIQKLPAEMQKDFGEFLRLSMAYEKAQTATDQLILSFGKKGE